MSLLDRLLALRMDLTPLRTSRDFGLLFAGGLVFSFGSAVTAVAIPFQVYAETGSNLLVGLVGLVELVPLVVFGLWGGALADHFDRRRLLVVAGLVQAALVGCLVLNTVVGEPRLWALFVLAACLTSTASLQRPSREALMPRTVRHEEIPAAQALSSLGSQLGLLAGPLVAGLLIAYVGLAWCFAIDLVGLLLASGLYAAMRPYPHTHDTTPPSLAAVVEGIRYGVGRRDLLGTYLVDIAAMFLALPVVLFPALVEEVYDDPGLLGLLYAAGTAGAMLATLTSGWVHRVTRHGRAIVVAAAAYGLMVAAAGLAAGVGSVWWVVVFLTLAGGADMVSAIFRGTVWNQTIPEHVRGRMAGIEMLSYSLGPRAGQVRAGFTADLFGVRAAVVGGGVACVAGVAATTLWLRSFWAYDSATDPYAVAEREERAARGEG